MSEKVYVVIGASAAGIAAIQKLRQLDQVSQIICISDEPQLPYNKCFLADYLNGHKTLEQVHTKTRAFFDEQRITLLLSTRVVQIDRKYRHLICADGTVIEYTLLLLAMGGSVRIPAFLDQAGHSTTQQELGGSKLPDGVFFLHTLTDTLKLHEWFSKPEVTRAVVMGAGLTGLECADTFAQFSIEGTVVELQDQLLKRHVDQQGAVVITKALQDQGVALRCGVSITGLVLDDQQVLQAVTLSDGSVLETDTLICALGSRSRSGLAQDAGLELLNGAIVTDPFLRTSDSFIWAAGDVASIMDKLTETPIPCATWPDAIQQGMYAAYAMAGQPRAYAGMMPITYSEFFGGTFHSAGFLEVYDNLGWTAEIDHSDGYAKVIFDENKVVQGFICFGSAHWNLVSYKRSFVSQTPIVL